MTNLPDFRISRTGALTAFIYPALFLCVYFLLVVHLRMGLGRWPDHISDNPRDALFHFHEVATQLLFLGGVYLVLFSGGLIPIFAAIPRTRRFATWFALFAAGGVAAFAAMHLAPGSFMMWWWD